MQTVRQLQPLLLIGGEGLLRHRRLYLKTEERLYSIALDEGNYIYIYRKVCKYTQKRQTQENSLPVCAPKRDVDKLACDEAAIDLRGRGGGVQARNVDPRTPLRNLSAAEKYPAFAT